jgi:SagB-type dehydrogenase family enzyme
MTQYKRRFEPKLAIEAAITNTLRPVRPVISSTGLRSHASRYDAGRQLGLGRVAEEFLINSRLRRGDAELGLSVTGYMTEQAETMVALLGQGERRGGECISLPPSVKLTMSLGEVLPRRRSVRTFSGNVVSLPALATILRAASGITGHASGQDGNTLRSAPSGGALYPIDLHLAVLRVEGLPQGRYVYDPHRDGLWSAGDSGEVAGLLDSLALPGQVIAEQEASVAFLLVGRPWRSMRKYGDRGMRNVFLEAGAIAEHISLAAVALGLGSVHCASFYDDEVHQALAVDGLYEALIHAVFLGALATADHA